MVKVRDCAWARASSLRKRLSGCLSYLFAAIAALFTPVEIDKAMYEVLREQFEQLADDGR